MNNIVEVRSLLRYKAAGYNATDEAGSLDTVEFINISKDDVLAYPAQVHRAYPSTVNARMDSTIKPFVKKSLAINRTLLSVFNERLGLPEGTLASLHPPEKYSGCEARCIKNPPPPDGVLPEAKVAIGAHTDFGSLVRLVYNRWISWLIMKIAVIPPQSSRRSSSFTSWIRNMAIRSSQFPVTLIRFEEFLS